MAGTAITILGGPVPVGSSVLASGPVVNSWSKVVLTLERGLQIGALTLAIEYAPDGVTWQRIGSATFPAAATGPLIFTFDPPLPSLPLAAMRAVSVSPAVSAFVSTGRSLVVT